MLRRGIWCFIVSERLKEGMVDETLDDTTTYFETYDDTA
jgi:hypothetical protein